MNLKKSIYQEYRRRLVDQPNQLVRLLAQKFDIERARVFAYKDGVKINIGLYGFWISIFIKPRKIAFLRFYEIHYIHNGKPRKKITFTLNSLLKVIKIADIQDVLKQNG